jgi:hypothetical protein
MSKQRSPNKKISQIWRSNIQSNTDIIVRRDYVFLIGFFCRGSDSEIRVENLSYDFWVEESKWIYETESGEIRINVFRLINHCSEQSFERTNFRIIFFYGGYIYVWKWTWPLFQLPILLFILIFKIIRWQKNADVAAESLKWLATSVLTWSNLTFCKRV